MTWLAWRQARGQALVAAVATAAVAAILVATRSHIAATPEDELSTFYTQLQLLGTVLVGVPAAIGVFWGAPLLARELELGTHRLAWTQSVTRRRWLGTRLGVLALLAVVATVVFAALFTWWSLPIDAHGNRIGTANFGQRGIAPVAYAVFALALGTFVGTVVRRTLPAMAITAVAFFVARYTFQLAVRPHLAGTVELPRGLSMFGPGANDPASAGAWVVSSKTVDGNGRVHPIRLGRPHPRRSLQPHTRQHRGSLPPVRRLARPPRRGHGPPRQPVLDDAGLGVARLLRPGRRAGRSVLLVGAPPHVLAQGPMVNPSRAVTLRQEWDALIG